MRGGPKAVIARAAMAMAAAVAMAGLVVPACGPEAVRVPDRATPAPTNGGAAGAGEARPFEDEPLATYLRWADLVVVGTLGPVTPLAGTTYARSDLRVEEVLKGSAGTETVPVVTAAKGGCPCGRMMREEGDRGIWILRQIYDRYARGRYSVSRAGHLRPMYERYRVRQLLAGQAAAGAGGGGG